MRRRHGARSWLGLVAVVLALGLLASAMSDLFLPRRDGLFGYSRVFAPYIALLFVPLGLLLVVVRGRLRWVLGVLVVLGLGVAIVRFMPTLPGRGPSDASILVLGITSWNLQATVASDVLGDVIRDREQGIVGLQELTPEQAEAIASDTDLRRAYPYQVLEPASDWTGMGLLSSWPLEGPVTTSAAPPMIATSVRPAGGTALDLIVAHAPPPTMGILRTGPRYDPSRRDAALQTIRERMDTSLEAGRPVVLLGDLNLTDREVAYSELVDGLTDAHPAAGVGWGHTWRPPVIDRLPFGLLRIDMVITGGGVRPTSSAPDCTPRGSDHCILDVVLVLDPRP